MANMYELVCVHCSELHDINDSVCDITGLSISGTINVKRASIKAEVDELEKRYQEANNIISANALIAELKVLESEVENNSKAVINCDLKFLWEWLGKTSSGYTSYRRQMIEKTRTKAKFENDVNRSLADSFLFGSEADIIYAALSVDEHGLISYGEVTVLLKNLPIEPRTSLLEMNSFDFLKSATQNGWSFGMPLPRGYMTIWNERRKLVVAKLIKSLKKGITNDEIARLILTSNGDRTKDEFVELYIYGKIVSKIVEKIKIPTSKHKTLNPAEILQVNELSKKYLVELY